MSAYEHFKKSVGYHEEKGNVDFTYSTKAARNILNEIDNRLKAIEKLQALLKDIPLQEGDVVHEAGYPEERGDIIEATNVGDEPFFRVRIRHLSRTIGYYRDELELIERPGA